MTGRLDRFAAAVADRYVVRRELGSGGMSVVYLADELQHNRPVAIKVLRPELGSIIGGDRFRREIEIVANLRHPNILPLLHSGSAGDFRFFVMPYVQGETLRGRLEREPQLDLEDAIAIAKEVAEALAYAHERGVVHRDIKPENVMLESGHAVVMDFGVALAMDPVPTQRLTDTGLSPGTPEYMSPEQASGERRVDGRSDIYSLGCVLYEMLVGDPPFSGANRQAVIARKLADDIPSLRIVREAVPPALERVVMRALARSPADRYKTAADLTGALDDVSRAIRRSRERHVQPGRWLHELVTVRTAAMVAGAMAALVLLLVAIGFLTTKAYDLKLQVPDQFTPTRTDFLMVGVEAMVPFVVFSSLMVLAVAVVSRLVRLGLSLRRGSATAPSDPARSKVGGPRRAIAADLFFVFTIVASAGALLAFSGYLDFLWTPDMTGLACTDRPLQREFSLTMTLLITGLSLLWLKIFPLRQSMMAGAGRTAAARWASLACIVGLVLVMTVPYRLVWDGPYQRVWVGGERGYVLVEDADEVTVYNADRMRAERYSRNEIEPLNTVGHLFENASAFRGREPGC
jgi:serine/threonine protein kinase